MREKAVSTRRAPLDHHLTAEARDKPAVTSLRLLAVLNVLSSTPPLVEMRANAGGFSKKTSSL